MLHWEDFGASNAGGSEQVRRSGLHVQRRHAGHRGSGVGCGSSAVRAAGSRMIDQRIVIHGAGTAGLGIADMIRIG